MSRNSTSTMLRDDELMMPDDEAKGNVDPSLTPQRPPRFRYTYDDESVTSDLTPPPPPPPAPPLVRPAPAPTLATIESTRFSTMIGDDDSMESDLPPPPPMNRPPSHLLGNVVEETYDADDDHSGGGIDGEFYPSPLSYPPIKIKREKEEEPKHEENDDELEESEPETPTRQRLRMTPFFIKGFRSGGADNGNGDGGPSSNAVPSDEELLETTPQGMETPEKERRRSPIEQEMFNFFRSIEDDGGATDVSSIEEEGIESPPLRHSLRSAADNDNNARPPKTLRRWCIIGSIISSLILIIVLAVGFGTGKFTQNNSRNGIAKAVGSETPPPTPPTVDITSTTVLYGIDSVLNRWERADYIEVQTNALSRESGMDSDDISVVITDQVHQMGINSVRYLEEDSYSLIVTTVSTFTDPTLSSWGLSNVAKTALNSDEFMSDLLSYDINVTDVTSTTIDPRTSQPTISLVPTLQITEPPVVSTTTDQPTTSPTDVEEPTSSPKLALPTQSTTTSPMEPSTESGGYNVKEDMPTFSPTFISADPTATVTIEPTSGSGEYNTEEDIPTSNPTLAFTPTAGPTRYELFLAIAQTSLLVPYDDVSVFDDPNSVESKSLNFLVYSDPAELDPTDTSAGNQIRIKQRYALLNLWYTFDNVDDVYSATITWKKWDNWLSENECTWFGVTCSVVTSLSDVFTGDMINAAVVTELNFNNNNLNGKAIPYGLLANLQHISTLDFSNNQLIGDLLPSSILVAQDTIEVLNLSNNTFARGPIPLYLYYLPNLRVLNLAYTERNGTLTSEIGQMSGSLEVLNIRYNYMVGSLPVEITNLVHLQILDIGENYFEGPLPSNIGNMRSLVEVRADTTYYPDEGDGHYGISGAIPPSIGDLSNLKVLLLYTGGLEDQIPTSVGLLTNLEIFDIHSNWLVGPIPTELGDAKNLMYVDVEDNALNGQVPLEMGNLNMLQEFYLAKNDIVGPMPGDVCALRANALVELYPDCDVGCDTSACCTGCYSEET